MVKRFPRAALWPLAVAAIVRIAAWSLIPGARFASDEHGYVDAGFALAATGQQDLFWPPLTGWIVALVKWIAPAASLAALRLLWVAIDLGNVTLVAVLATRMARTAMPDRAAAFVFTATVGYALYLPAISHAQFVTSEIPALFLVLASLVVMTSDRMSLTSDLGAGAMLGALLLVRANLLPLLILLPAAAFWNWPRPIWLRRSAIVAAVGALVVAAAIARNWMVYQEPSLSRNAAYNLYIGNRDVYAEDLNLFHPQATAAQIEFRRQFFAGTLQYPTGSAAELQRAAVEWIAQHPGEFAKRALGRLARVFAPKTDVLELVGGEARAGVFAPVPIALLVTANLQWAAILFGGLLGLRILMERDRRMGLTLVSTIAGSVLLCLVAISKPRYSFVFDPLLILAAAFVLMMPAPERALSWRRLRLGLAPAYIFLAWGWIAWMIFALSSRLAR
jgi:hypothetical protein